MNNNSNGGGLEESLLSRLKRSEKVLFKVFKSPNWTTYLDYSYLPQNPKHREEEIADISFRIAHLILGKASGNMVIHGGSGTGKTMSFLIAKRVVEKYLKEKGIEDYRIVYVAATGRWSALLNSVCKHLGLTLPERGISLSEYFEKIKEIAKNTYIHLCIDDFDKLFELEPKVRSKAQTEDMLYILTRTANISFTLITNKVDLTKVIDDSRVLSSLDTLNTIYFKPYTFEQCRDILLDRLQLVFNEGVFDDKALDVLASHIAKEGGDIRRGLDLLRFCGEYLVKNGLTHIDSELMKRLIYIYDVMSDGQKLIETLTVSDKLVLIAIYHLLSELKTNVLYTGDIFAKQDYYRRVMGMPSIGRKTFSVYLTKLSTLGIIDIKRKWVRGSNGPKAFIQLNYPLSAVRYMIENDPALRPINTIIGSDYNLNTFS
jgi:cell division control protein 6